MVILRSKLTNAFFSKVEFRANMKYTGEKIIQIL